VEPATARSLYEVVREAREHVASARSAGRRRYLARHALQSGHVRSQAARTEAERLQDDRGRPADLLRERVEELLDVDRAGSGFLLGASQELEHRGRQIGEPGGRLVDAAERRFGLDGHVRRVGAGLPKDLLNTAIAIDGARQEVDRLHLRVLALVRETLRARDE